MDYWEECIRAAFKEAKITATEEQIGIVAGEVKVSSENYGMAQGYDNIPSHKDEEIKRLKKEVVDEREMIFCNVCNSKGSIVISGAVRSGYSQCWKCHGRGRHKP